MQAIAGSHLCNFHSQDLRKLLQAAVEHPALLENSDQSFRVNAEGGGFDLNYRARVCSAKTRNQRQPDKTFLANQTHFHALSIGKHAQNGH
jgi:hypothetical protein